MNPCPNCHRYHLTTDPIGDEMPEPDLCEDGSCPHTGTRFCRSKVIDATTPGKVGDAVEQILELEDS